MRVTLSLLICTLPERAELLAGLIKRLEGQRDAHRFDVEILTNNTPRGKMNTGRKRNKLLARAGGDYIAFIDDDDLVHEAYLPRIMAALVERPDVVGIELLMQHGGRESRCVHSRRYSKWFDAPDGPRGDRVYFRCPNHLNPVRRKLAITARFPEVNIGEDRYYSLALRPELETEVMLDGPPVYLYRAGSTRDYTAAPPAGFGT